MVKLVNDNEISPKYALQKVLFFCERQSILEAIHFHLRERDCVVDNCIRKEYTFVILFSSAKYLRNFLNNTDYQKDYNVFHSSQEDNLYYYIHVNCILLYIF